MKQWIKLTRVLGDFSENMDYQSAISDSKYNELKINEIKSILFSSATTSRDYIQTRINLNSIIIMKSERGIIRVFSIMGSNDAARCEEDNSTNVNIMPSKLQKEFLSKKRGDKVVVSTVIDGQITTGIYKIIAII